jgi:hypothetical protein
MPRRLILLTIGIAFFSVAVRAQSSPQKPPEHFKYFLVFRHTALLNQKAAEMERKGEDGSKFRNHYKNYAALNDLQVSQLNQVAQDCLREVGVIDARIKQIVTESRARIPGGRLEPGQPLPQPTAELKELDQERDQIIRSHYMKLRDRFGEAEFKRFAQVVEKSVRLNVTPVGEREGGPRKPPVITNPQK